jgi:hypothetical protein
VKICDDLEELCRPLDVVEKVSRLVRALRQALQILVLHGLEKNVGWARS